MKLFKVKLVYLILSSFQVFLYPTKLYAQIKEYTTNIEHGIYSLEVKTTSFRANIYPLYDTNTFPASLKQEFIFKKNNVVIAISTSPAVQFKHKNNSGDRINLLEISFIWVNIEMFKGEKVYHFVAYLCNGYCPDIDLVFSLDGELLLMTYMREQTYFQKYEADRYTVKDLDGHKEGKMYMIKPFE